MVLFLVPSIILGVLGHKAVRGTHSKIAELTATPEPLVKSARTTLTALSFTSVSAGFASAVGGFCAVVNTYNGSSAHDEPIKLHTAIAADVKAISKSPGVHGKQLGSRDEPFWTGPAILSTTRSGLRI